jgi:hypothetical protein
LIPPSICFTVNDRLQYFRDVSDPAVSFVSPPSYSNFYQAAFDVYKAGSMPAIRE